MLVIKSATLCIFLYLTFVTADTQIVFEKNETVSDDLFFKIGSIYNSLLSVVGEKLSNSESTKKIKIFHTSLDCNSKPRYCELALKFDFYFKSYDSLDHSIAENINTISINDDATFDILYNDVKVCGDKVCRLTFDAQGNKVTGPIASFVPLTNAYRTRQKVPSSQDFVLIELKSDEAYKISLIKSDGQVVLNQFKDYDDIRDHAVSTTHGLIRLCSKTNTTKIDCELFDYNDGKMTSKMSVDANQKVEYIEVYNMANGKFLLLIKVDYDLNKDTTAMKIGSDGSSSGVVKLPYLACDGRQELEHFVDITNNQYCVIKVCVADHNLRMIKECFGDNEFH